MMRMLSYLTIVREKRAQSAEEVEEIADMRKLKNKDYSRHADAEEWMEFDRKFLEELKEEFIERFGYSAEPYL